MRLIIFSLLLCTGLSTLAQKQNFCGAQYNKKENIKEQLQEQFDFLDIHENDTIVDVGAASGWYEGAFSAISDLQKVHFLLVDISEFCLNEEKVGSMVDHYSKVKGSRITNGFTLVKNTPDSLMLPKESFRKVWLLNTLHEIPDPSSIIKQMHFILKPGGEVVVLEIVPKKPGQLHGGCNQPLMSFEAIRNFFETNGFSFEEKKLVQPKKRVQMQMLRFKKIAG